MKLGFLRGFGKSLSLGFGALQGGGTPWYLAGDSPTPIAAYKPKGAANLAASLVNIVTPGTHDLTAGSVPGFDTSVGWQWGGNLISDLVPTLSWSVIFRATSLIAETKMILGCQTSASQMFWIRNTGPASGTVQCSNGTSGGYLGVALLTGTYAMCGKKVYRNGVSDGADIGAGGTDPTHPIYIGGYNNAGTPVSGITQGSMQAVAFYNTTLTAAQVLAVHTAMAAL